MNNKMISIIGPTGSGKTLFLEQIKNNYPTLQLESLARHRGSAFGSLGVPQPSQIDFENHLAMAILKIEENYKNNWKSSLVEDESRLIGKCILPDTFFSSLQKSHVIWIDESMETRVNNIFMEYIMNSPIGSKDEVLALQQFAKYKNSLMSISKKLGDLRTKEIMILLDQSEADFKNSKNFESNCLWIEKLLLYYYDPLYFKSIEKRQVKVIFKGTRLQCLHFIKNRGNDETS